MRGLDELKTLVDENKKSGKKIVFTNGCFDLLHRGHLHLLREAKKYGEILIVAVNSDSSVRKIKGPNRPIFSEEERVELIASLEMVNYVVVFVDGDPYNVIKKLKPDILVKGGDWSQGEVVGRDIVEGSGGKLAIIPLLQGYSTTNIIERIRRG
jgi:D-beta-D-heptose 7-phosphate kinase/D-beta-D-heptose 1-phosphate adenosyltransferase